MLFEFINSLLIDVSFIYVSFIVLMMVFAVSYVSRLSSKQLMNRQFVLHDSHQLMKVNRDQIKQPLTINEAFVTWLTILFERSDEQDDEIDSESSYVTKDKNIRGGQLCRNNSYSSSVVRLSDFY